MMLVLFILLLIALAIAAGLYRELRAGRNDWLLKESEERFRLLAENSLAGIYLIDRSEAIRYANRTLAAIFGYQREELIGMSYRALIHPDDLPLVSLNFGKLICGEEGLPCYEVRGRHKDGSFLDLEILGSVSPGDRGDVVTGTVLDITLRKRAEMVMQKEQQRREELTRLLEQRVREEVEKSREKDRLMLQQSRFAAMGEMIGNIAHQWRQPLNMLGILIQQMQMEQEKGTMTARVMEERVAKGMEILLHLSRTIDDFRNFFRPQSEPAPFCLGKAVFDTVSFFEPSCSVHRINITIEGHCERILNGHINQFTQVLLNILNNARDALLDTRTTQPSIVVSMREDGTRSEFTIRDNAGGIDAAVIEKIFDPYFTTKEEGKGTGVGLYLAKTIIERNMQGRISASNVNGGAEFKIVL